MRREIPSLSARSKLAGPVVYGSLTITGRKLVAAAVATVGDCNRRGTEKGAQINAIGSSRGGPRTKVHVIVDALGLPVQFKLTEGQGHDSICAVELIARAAPSCLLADKAYDTNAFGRRSMPSTASP